MDETSPNNIDMFDSAVDSDADAPVELNGNDYQISVLVNTMQISHKMLALLKEQQCLLCDEGKMAGF